MEDGEGEGGPGKLSGGTGLGEGEGKKDVSERIENQVMILILPLYENVIRKVYGYCCVIVRRLVRIVLLGLS